jgi:hypothetical protein
VCDGNPYDCRAFLVGINPASAVPFWEFWNNRTGFDKQNWFERYKRYRIGMNNKPDISPTRRRIEWIVEAASETTPNVKVLETNLFSVPTPRAAHLRREDKRTEAFEYLLDEIKATVILLHGRPAHRFFQEKYGCSPTPNFNLRKVRGRICHVAAVPHLMFVSRETATQLGHEMARRSSQLDYLTAPQTS